MLKQQKIWDLVTRLWHWVLVFSVTTAWIFGEYMSFDNVDWHFYLGYLTLGLIASITQQYPNWKTQKGGHE